MNEIITVNGSAVATSGNFSEGLFSKWIAYIDRKPKTVQTYTRAVRQFSKYLSDNCIAQPTRETVIAYRKELEEKGHKPSTIQAYIIALKLFFKWTAAESLYPNIADRVEGAKINRDFKKDYLTSKQTKRLMISVDRNTLKGKRDYAILSLMVTAGLRTVEVIRADIQDIKTVGDSTALFLQGKGRDERSEYVKLAEPVEEAILDYLAARGKAEPTAPLFASVSNRDNGERLSTKSISRLVKEHFSDIGLNSDRLTAHSLRHTAAVLNLMNGGTVEETRQLLRHSDINTTLIYTHAIERAKNESEKRIASAIFGA